MDEKIIIKYLDLVINNLDNPFDEFNVLEFLFNDKEHLDKCKNRSETYAFEKALTEFALVKKIFIKFDGHHWFKLTDKGIELKYFKKGYVEFEKHLKKQPLTLFQKIQLFTTILSISVAVTFGVLNYLLSSQKSELQDQNNLLKNDLVRYKDSISAYKQKALLEKLKTLHDTTQSKH